MKALELAQKYLDYIFLHEDYSSLRKIFADDLVFRGPLYSFDTAEDYINSMLNNPPKHFEYELLKSYEDETSACIIYKFSKPGISTMMTQTFEVENGKIKSILLVFDTKAFA